MNKGLEALKEIKQIKTSGIDMGKFTDVKIGSCPNYWKWFDTIEKELVIGDMAIKSLKYIFDLTPSDSFDDIDEKLQEHYKKLKALEIIKVVCPNVFWITRTYTYEEYKKKCSDDTLLQEEYELLKEVLL